MLIAEFYVSCGRNRRSPEPTAMPFGVLPNVDQTIWVKRSVSQYRLPEANKRASRPEVAAKRMLLGVQRYLVKLYPLSPDHKIRRDWQSAQLGAWTTWRVLPKNRRHNCWRGWRIEPQAVRRYQVGNT